MAPCWKISRISRRTAKIVYRLFHVPLLPSALHIHKESAMILPRGSLFQCFRKFIHLRKLCRFLPAPDQMCSQTVLNTLRLLSACISQAAPLSEDLPLLSHLMDSAGIQIPSAVLFSGQMRFLPKIFTIRTGRYYIGYLHAELDFPALYGYGR